MIYARQMQVKSVCKLVKKTDFSLITGNILKKVLILYSECTHEYSLFLNVLEYKYEYICSRVQRVQVHHEYKKKCTRVHEYASTMYSGPNPVMDSVLKSQY